MAAAIAEPEFIAVTDRAKALAVWAEVVGLELLSEEGNELRLGIGGKTAVNFRDVRRHVRALARVPSPAAL